MGCIYVDVCPEDKDCFPRLIDCECGGCPGSTRDPNSVECQCRNEPDCTAPKTQRIFINGACQCVCPDPPPECPNNKALNPNTCTCECDNAPTCEGGAVPNENCSCECADPNASLCFNAVDNRFVCVFCPDDNSGVAQFVDPNTCACAECAAPNRRSGKFCCPPLPENHDPAPTDKDPCHTCPKDTRFNSETGQCEACELDGTHAICNGECVPTCETQFPGAGKVFDNNCLCVCPDDKTADANGNCVPCPVDNNGNPGTHEFCNDKCLPKCTGGKVRQPDANPPNCDCACPPDKLVDPNDDSLCIDCPVDAPGVVGTHDICNGQCLPKCPSGQVRAVNDCSCYCPPGKQQIQLPDGSFDCVNITYTCVNGECFEAPYNTGQYDTLTACNLACGVTPACFPVPTAPPGTPIMCPNGVTQLGLITYPVFDTVTCSWPPVPFYFGTSCDGASGSSGGGGGGGGGGDCCANADPGPIEFTRVCGATVPKKVTNFTAPCAGFYTEYTWCTTCFNGSVPFLKRTDTYIFNPFSCEFELFMPTGDLQVCPAAESSTSGGGGEASGTSSSTTAQSSSSRSSSSRSASSDSAQSSGSSSSGCSAENVSIVFSVSSNGSPLSNFGPGSTARVTVFVSNLGAAARSGVHWALLANGAAIAEFDVLETDPNPRTFTLSAEELLATLGLTFETAPLSSYAFDFCGRAVNCANVSAFNCNGQITVRIPGRSSTSSVTGSSAGGQSSASVSTVSSSAVATSSSAQKSSASAVSSSSSTAQSSSGVSASSTSSISSSAASVLLSSSSTSSVSAASSARSSSSSTGSQSSARSSLSGASSSCAALGDPPCACYLIVAPADGCPEYRCLPNETCCEAIFGQRFDGGNAATNCGDNVVDLNVANPALGCLNCQAGSCGCEETIDGGNAYGNQPANRDCGTAAGCGPV